MKTKQWFHVIGISGKATANIAVMFKEMGWFVTGSDHQFLPPASDIVKDNDIPYALDYHYSHLTKQYWEEQKGSAISIGENPDLVLIVESLSEKNKEYLFAKNKGLDVRPYSQILGEYLVKENSIVVVGTAGKTTTTAIITHVLNELRLNPSYMIGAEIKGFDSALKQTDSRWSVLEGDEYHSRKLSNGPKFMEYKAKYGIITNIGYEHQDIFPTQDEYDKAFANFAESVPQDGVLVVNAEDEKIRETISSTSCNIVTYRTVQDFSQVGNGSWSILKDEDKYIIFNESGEEFFRFTTKLLGEFVPEDILAAVALLASIPDLRLDVDEIAKISNALNTFKGVKKRLEILYQDEVVVIIDDFAVAPNRAKNSLTTLRKSYPNKRIIAVYEPNSGSRIQDNKAFDDVFEGAFDEADVVYVPELSDFNEKLLSQEELLSRLQAYGINAYPINSEKLVDELSAEDGIIVFMSSYRLDSKVKELVSAIKS